MTDEKTTDLAVTVVKTLSARGETLALAESFTGGGIARAITSVPGASAVLREGLVTYSVDAKIARLGVKSETVDSFGVVSREVALEMAYGALNSELKPTYAVSATGNAGPSTQANTEACVGYVAAVSANRSTCVKLALDGDRERNMRDGAVGALNALLTIVN